MEQNTIPHLSLEASISSLYAPELRFKASGNDLLVGQGIKLRGHINNKDLYICQAKGCSPDKKNGVLFINEQDFEFILAWKDEEKNELYTSSYKGMEGLRPLYKGIFPFVSQIIELNISGLEFDLTTSLHIELPHYITRYTVDTINLQHVFSESGLKAPTYMGGCCNNTESYQMHLHYKALNAFKKMATPAITMISAAYLNLATILAGGVNWRDKPAVVFGILCVNTSAFASLASIKAGSTSRSLLNLVRLLAVLWVLTITVGIRGDGLPFIEFIVDSGLKASVVWLIITAIFSFTAYSSEKDSDKREKIFAIFCLCGLFLYLLSLFAMNPFHISTVYNKMMG